MRQGLPALEERGRDKKGQTSSARNESKHARRIGSKLTLDQKPFFLLWQKSKCLAKKSILLIICVIFFFQVWDMILLSEEIIFVCLNIPLIFKVKSWAIWKTSISMVKLTRVHTKLPSVLSWSFYIETWL